MCSLYLNFPVRYNLFMDYYLISDVTAIIFVVACSSYNLVLREDPSQVRLFSKLSLLHVSCMIHAD